MYLKVLYHIILTMTGTNTDTDYSNGKIYKLVNTVDNNFYIGSTKQSLHERLDNHISTSKSHPHRKVYKHICNIGWNNVRIELVENHPCNTERELVTRERYWYDVMAPQLNSCRPMATDEEHKQLKKLKREKYDIAYKAKNRRTWTNGVLDGKVERQRKNMIRIENAKNVTLSLGRIIYD